MSKELIPIQINDLIHLSKRFTILKLLFQIEDIILINKQRLIAFKHLWSFLKFETKLKFPSISATSVTFYLPNFIPFLFPFSSFLSSSYSNSIAIFILPHSILPTFSPLFIIPSTIGFSLYGFPPFLLEHVQKVRVIATTLDSRIPTSISLLRICTFHRLDNA